MLVNYLYICREIKFKSPPFMKELKYRDGKTKKGLINLYLSQYSEKDIRIYINDIIKDYRPQKNKRCKNISLSEFLTFVELYGLPEGYCLSQELERQRQNMKLKV